MGRYHGNASLTQGNVCFSHWLAYAATFLWTFPRDTEIKSRIVFFHIYGSPESTYYSSTSVKNKAEVIES